MKLNSTEASIKKILVSHLQVIEKHNPAFIYEMNVAKFTCRADVIVANGRLSVYEIKSASDKLDRLPKQLDIYRQYFEKVTVVCAPEHLEGVKKLVHPGVGIWIIDAKGKLTKHKRGRLGTIPKEKWLSFLPVDILRKLLKENNLRGVGDRGQLIKSVRDNLDEKLIRHFVLEYMKVRHLRIDRIKKKQEENMRIRREFEVQLNDMKKWLKDLPNIDALKAIPRSSS